MHQDLAKALYGRAKCSSSFRLHQEKVPSLSSPLVAEAALPGPSKQITIPTSPSNCYSFQFSQFSAVAFPPEVLGRAPQHCGRRLCFGSWSVGETGVCGGFTADPARPSAAGKVPPAPGRGLAQKPWDGLTALVQPGQISLQTGRGHISF